MSAVPFLADVAADLRRGSRERCAAGGRACAVAEASRSSPSTSISPRARRRRPSGDRSGIQAARRGGDLLFLIYTSGTTGLPKAARISHLKAALTGMASWKSQGLGPDDRIYCCLPLYHSAGGMMAVGAALMSGGSIVIARKFSASQFWSDCVRHEVDVDPVHRRALSLPRELPVASRRAQAPHPQRDGQRTSARRLAGLPGALRDPADRRVLRRDRGQPRAPQHRPGASGRSASCPSSSASASASSSCASTSRRRSSCAGATACASAASRTRRASS